MSFEKRTMLAVTWVVALFVITTSAVRGQFLARFANPKVEVTMMHAPGFPLEVERAAVIPEAGDECAEEFAAAVVERFVDNGVELVDRQNLDQMFEEMDFGLSGRVDPATAVELGKLLGPTALVTIEVQRCATDRQRLTKKHRNLKGEVFYEYISRTSGSFKGTVRVTDLATGKIFKAKTVDSSPSREKSSYDGSPEFPSEFEVRDAFLADATLQVHRMFFPWSERRELYFFDDDECNLEAAYKMLKIGETASAARRSEESLEVCKTADVKPKFLARAYYNLGMTRFLQSRFDEALDLLQTAYGLDGGNIISESISECRRAQTLAAEMAELEESGSFEVAAASGDAPPTRMAGHHGSTETDEAGAAGSGQGPAGSVQARLEQLKALHDQGLITDSEYQAKRQEILKDI